MAEEKIGWDESPLAGFENNILNWMMGHLVVVGDDIQVSGDATLQIGDWVGTMRIESPNTPVIEWVASG